MPIQNMQVGQAGLSGVKPRMVYIDTTDPIDSVVVAGYLNGMAAKFNIGIEPGDLAMVRSITPDGDPVSAVCEIQLNGANWSLATRAVGDLIASGNVIAGDGYVPGYLESNAGDGVGALKIKGNANLGDVDVFIQNAAVSGDTNYILDTANPGTYIFMVTDNTIQAPDPIFPIYGTKPLVDSAALASGGEHELNQSATGTDKSALVWDITITIQIPFTGGNKDLQISSGGNVFSVIPAATLGKASNTTARWGDADLPAPGSGGYSLSTLLGQPLVAKYVGGSTDYTAGQITIATLCQRVE